MKKIKEISFDDLMRLLNFSDSVDFRRLLRNRGFQVSSRKPIPRKKADEIAIHFTGKKIPWKELETERNAYEAANRLEKGHSPEDINAVKQWYQQVALDKTVSKTVGETDRLLGMVCEGGFLEGGHRSEFILPLNLGINILIGERGSGKSTVLNLLGLLSDSVGVEAKGLVEKILNILYPNANNGLNEITKSLKHALDTLNFYSIDRYAIYFSSKETVYCFFVNVLERRWDLLRKILSGNVWKSVTSHVKPSMLLFKQGEVIRITDERENIYYLNSIIDGIYPDLYNLRIELTREAHSLLLQFEYYNPNATSGFLPRQPSTRRFLDARYDEIKNIRRELERGFFSRGSLSLIQGYLDQSRYFIDQQSDLAYKTKPIMSLLADDDALYYLYVGRIVRFLMDDIETISSLFKTSVHGSTLRGEKAIKTAEHMVDFLRRRLRILGEWVKIYQNKRYVVYDEPLKSLVTKYIGFLQKREHLIRLQMEKCEQITYILREGESDIRVYTIAGNDVLEKNRSKIENLLQLPTLFENIKKADTTTKLDDLREWVNTYDASISALLSDLKEMYSHKTSSDSDVQPLIFTPISIDLRQGNTYRNFRQLSFGQKSGVILKIVLSTTEKHIIIIDQPEDNLDAYSIVNMLAPSLGKLSKERQIILATHNSNLVIGLKDSHLHVLKSWGESGRLKASGSSLEKSLVREMMDVLEGGEATFGRKLLNYERFIKRVEGLVPDIDVAFIESSYRRRTIDGLSNYLQPIVSDRAALDHARHELKHLDATRLQQDIHQFQSSLEENSLLDKNNIVAKVSHLIGTLDTHITRFLETINDIRMMDINPKPEYVNLYDVLLGLQADYTDRLKRGERHPRIEIDAELQGVYVWCDKNHLNLIFRNLFENALRATEIRAVKDLLSGQEPVDEMISIRLEASANDYVRLIFVDNGKGMSPAIRSKIYRERCSDQTGSDHGLGAVIISKLLNLNSGSIEVLESRTDGSDIGTTQQIVFLAHGDTK